MIVDVHGDVPYVLIYMHGSSPVENKQRQGGHTVDPPRALLEMSMRIIQACGPPFAPC